MMLSAARGHRQLERRWCSLRGADSAARASGLTETRSPIYSTVHGPLAMTWNKGRLLSPIEEEGDIEEPGALMGDADAESSEEGSQQEGHWMCP